MELYRSMNFLWEAIFPLICNVKGGFEKNVCAFEALLCPLEQEQGEDRGVTAVATQLWGLLWLLTFGQLAGGGGVASSLKSRKNSMATLVSLANLSCSLVT